MLKRIFPLSLALFLLVTANLVTRAQGRPDAALDFFDQAQQTARRAASEQTRSWLTVLTADALARVGRAGEA